MVTYKRRSKYLLIAAIMLLFAGLLLIALSVQMQDTAIRQEAAEYDLLTQQMRESETTFLTMEEITETDTAPDENVQAGSAAPSVMPLPTESPAEMPEPTDVPDSAAPVYMTGVDLAACQARNPDFIGWIQIPDTNVDYPVVWTDDPDYYLNHTFTGTKSGVGTIFSLIQTDYAAPSQNIAIYGHHLSSSGQRMFTSLLNYKHPEFYPEHSLVYLDTLYRPGTYRIFAVINMHVGDWDMAIPDFESDEDFMAFIARAKQESLYDTGVEVDSDDQIITLITCDRRYGGKTGRLVVMAVREP